MNGATDVRVLSRLEDWATVRIRARLYTTVILLLAVAAAIVPEVPRRVVVCGMLLATAFVPALALRTVPYQHAQPAWELAILCVASGLTALVPELWAPALLSSTVVLSWLSASASRAFTSSACLVVLVPFGLLGSQSGYRGWPAMYAAALIVGLGYAQLGSVHRRQFVRLEHQLETVLTAAGVVIYECDLSQNTIATMVGPIESITGWTIDEWTTVDHRGLVHPDDLDRYWLHADRLASGQVFDRTGRFRRRDGSWAHLRDVSQLNVTRMGRSLLTGLTMDVSQISEALETARHNAEYDQLTGLPNRLSWQLELVARLESVGEFAVILLDIDRFKAINDTLGHASGDRVLVEFANRLVAQTGSDHLVARLGGDEFALIMEEAQLTEPIERWAERLAATLGMPIQLDELAVSAAASIGIVRSVEHRGDAESMLRWADIAMYEAKRRARSVCMFDTALGQTSVQDLVLGGDFRRALAAGEIVAHFQPQVDLLTGRIVGAEALARWHHPELGMLTAERFVRLLQVSDQFEAFTYGVLTQAVEAQARCRSLGLDLVISANVSARSLHDSRLADRLAELCARYDVPPNALTIEVTEDELIESAGAASDTLRRLNDHGVRLSVDDFGTGYASFARITDHAFDEIKVERSLVAQTSASERSRVILSSVVEMAGRLGYRVVAEGVERPEEAETLRHAGCTVAQGFLYGAALPIDEFVAAAVRSVDNTHVLGRGGPVTERSVRAADQMTDDTNDQVAKRKFSK